MAFVQKFNSASGERMAFRSPGCLGCIESRLLMRHGRGRALPALLLATTAFAVPAFAVSAQASPRELIKRAVASIETETGRDVLGRYPNTDELCVREAFCEGFIDELVIEAMGRRIEVRPASRTEPDIFYASCVGLLGAFVPRRPEGDVEAFVLGGLARAIEGEAMTAEFETFRFEIALNAERLPACTVVQYVE